jgi:hypothetical protein
MFLIFPWKIFPPFSSAIYFRGGRGGGGLYIVQSAALLSYSAIKSSVPVTEEKTTGRISVSHSCQYQNWNYSGILCRVLF